MIYMDVSFNPHNNLIVYFIIIPILQKKKKGNWALGSVNFLTSLSSQS